MTGPQTYRSLTAATPYGGPATMRISQVSRCGSRISGRRLGRKAVELPHEPTPEPRLELSLYQRREDIG